MTATHHTKYQDRSLLQCFSQERLLSGSSYPACSANFWRAGGQAAQPICSEEEGLGLGQQAPASGRVSFRV